MNKTKYTIYWTACDGKSPLSRVTYDLNEALREMKNMRKVPDMFQSIAMCSESEEQVGGMGVDSVYDGVLPDGQDYVYKTGRDRGREPR